MATDNLAQNALQAYKNRQWGEAISRYSEIERQGVHSPVLFYNLGNCYYQDRQLGQAILYYQRAQRLAPRDPDIRKNLGIAVNQQADQSEADAKTQDIFRIADNFIFGNISLQESYGLLAVVLLMLNLYWLIVKGRRIKWSWSIVIWLMILLTIVSLVATGKYYQDKVEENGVIIIRAVTVRSGPRESFPAVFTLHEGYTFKVIKHSGSWIQLELNNGWRGWVEEKVYMGV